MSLACEFCGKLRDGYLRSCCQEGSETDQRGDSHFGWARLPGHAAYEQARSLNRNFLRCVVCRKTVTSWPIGEVMLWNFVHTCEAAIDTRKARSPEEKFMHTSAFAAAYLHEREAHIDYPVVSEQQKQRWAYGAWVAADDVVRLYAEQLKEHG